MRTSSDDNKSKAFKIEAPSFEETSKVFSGVRFNVHALTIPGKEGQTVRREVIVHPGAVLILPLIDKENLVMIHNQRFAVKQELWELPAGTLEPGETPAQTAARELVEETGYRAALIEKLTAFYTTPGYSNELMYTFVANELTHVGQSLDDNERIRVEIVSWKKALKMVKDGTIIDGKTIAALLFYHVFLNNAGGN